MTVRIVFSPEAQEQLAALYRYVAAQASPDIADRFTEAIIGFCESLSTFPRRGIRRDDVRKGLRVTNYRKRVIIAFSLGESTVSILGVYYGGQDYESMLEDAGEP